MSGHHAEGEDPKPSIEEIEAGLHAEIARRFEDIEEAVSAAISDLRPIPGVDGPEKIPEPSAYFKAGKFRRGFGYVLQVFTLVAVLAIVALELLWRVPELTKNPPKDETELYFLLALIGAQAVVSVAVVFLFVRTSRAAERMSLPHWWLDDPARASLMLGEGRQPTALNVGLPRWPGGGAKASDGATGAPAPK